MHRVQSSFNRYFMEKVEECIGFERPLRCRGVYVRTDQLLQAVLEDDLTKLKSLVEAGESVNRNNNRGVTLLEHAIVFERVEIFDYLMGLADLEVDRLDKCGGSALMLTAGNEYFALGLLKKGANIHLRNHDGDTFLHVAARNADNITKLGQLVIEKGANINSCNNEGKTPLYQACEAGNGDWIYMFLHYGALATVPSNKGILPVAVLSENIPQEDRWQLEEILFDHTFDQTTDKAVQLSTLVEAMRLESQLFTKIVEIISDVEYGMDDLEQLSSSLIHMNPSHLKLFMSKFQNIIRNMIEHFSCFVTMMNELVSYPMQRCRDILYFFLESEYLSDFIQASSLMQGSVATLIVNKFEMVDYIDESRIVISDQEIFEIVYILLAYGYRLSSSDLDAVYKFYGHSELFKILLHMDITVDNESEYVNMAALYYNPQTTIDVFCNQFSVSVELLSFFNHPKLKEVCLSKSVDEEIAAKAKTLPPLPCLVELSRNAARQYIINRYKVRNSMQFYTVLNSLPIGEITKGIIALEKTLY